MAELRLQGRTALVTGAAKRLGHAISLRLASDGANVVIHYNRSGEDAEKLKIRLIDSGVKAWTVQADLSVSDDYESLVGRALDLSGSLDILVNNASVFSSGDLMKFSLDDLNKNIEVNTWAPFVLCRTFRDYCDSGSIVNILDTRVADLDLKHPAYILSRKMLLDLTEMMAVGFAPKIMVNAVAPGLILPPPGKDKSYLEALMGSVPLKRHGKPADIADAVSYLVSSDFITGQVIYVDGGRHLREYEHG